MKHVKLFSGSQDVQFQRSISINFVIFCRFASLPKQWEEYLPEFFVDSPKNEDIYRGIKDCHSSCSRMNVIIVLPPYSYRIVYCFLQTFQLEWTIKEFQGFSATLFTNIMLKKCMYVRANQFYVNLIMYLFMCIS